MDNYAHANGNGGWHSRHSAIRKRCGIGVRNSVSEALEACALLLTQCGDWVDSRRSHRGVAAG